MPATLLASAFSMLAASVLAWGAMVYALQRQWLTLQGGALVGWVVGGPVCVWVGFVIVRAAWRGLVVRRAASREQARTREADQASEAKIDEARREDRRFDGVVVLQSELVLPAEAYARDFTAALKDNVGTVTPTEIHYDGDAYTIGARRIPDPAGTVEFDVYHRRSLRVAALYQRALGRLCANAAGVISTLAETVRAFDAEHPIRTEPLHYWEQADTAVPPSLSVRLLHDHALADDARSMQQAIEVQLDALGLPPRLAVTVETRAADASEALAQFEEVIDAVRTEPSRAWLIIAADSQFDDEFLRSAMESTRSSDPAAWQQRSQAVPSEGAAALFLASETLAATMKRPSVGCLKRPVSESVAEAVDGVRESAPSALLFAALVRAAVDFDSPPPGADVVWLDADTPDKRLIASCQALASMPRAAAVDAHRPRVAVPAGSPPAQDASESPEIVAVRRVFGALGAVNAVGIVSAALHRPSNCDLALAFGRGGAVALAVTEPAPASAMEASAPAAA